jgi:hypothetical protein
MIFGFGVQIHESKLIDAAYHVEEKDFMKPRARDTEQKVKVYHK